MFSLLNYIPESQCRKEIFLEANFVPSQIKLDTIANVRSIAQPLTPHFYAYVIEFKVSI